MAKAPQIRGSAGIAAGYKARGGHFGGTGGLPLVDVSDDVAGGPISPMVVSDYMSYGSYSGADCKVIVHYPFDDTGLKIEQKWLEAQEAELERLEKERDNNLNNASYANSLDEQIRLINDGIRDSEEKTYELRHGPTSKVLAEAATFSWSTFREKDPVRTLGSVYPRGFTRGPRSISGTIVFTVFYEHVLHEVMKLNLRYKSTGVTDNDQFQQTTMLPDQLPPLDISLVFANEYGASSQMGVYGMEFFQEGAAVSIEDLYTESTLSYVARDFDPMRSVSQRTIDSKGVTNGYESTASDMLRTKDALQNGHLYRRDPFI